MGEMEEHPLYVMGVATDRQGMGMEWKRQTTVLTWLRDLFRLVIGVVFALIGVSCFPVTVDLYHVFLPVYSPGLLNRVYKYCFGLLRVRFLVCFSTNPSAVAHGSPTYLLSVLSVTQNKQKDLQPLFGSPTFPRRFVASAYSF